MTTARQVQISGRWPSFHDAEMLRVRLDHDAELGAALEADIRLFEMTSEVDDRGYFVPETHPRYAPLRWTVGV